MAKKAKSSGGGRKTSRKGQPRRSRPLRWAGKWLFRIVLLAAVLMAGLIAMHSVVNPGAGFYMRAERARLGGVQHDWVPIDSVAPVMVRSVVAAEDANYCAHWGFDMGAIRDAIADGGERGASTVSQQVVKNVYLWHGRSYVRKALETLMTPVVETFWSKRRILEVYLNVAEFDEGVFGIDAAARHYFGVAPRDLTAVQAARLAAILPSPKSWNAAQPTEYLRRRSSQILDGAETIRRDGRAGCFED